MGRALSQESAPACCPGGTRCKGGVTSSLALGWHMRTSRLDTVMAVQLGTDPSPWRPQPWFTHWPQGKADVNRFGLPDPRT